MKSKKRKHFFPSSTSLSFDHSNSHFECILLHFLQHKPLLLFFSFCCAVYFCRWSSVTFNFILKQQKKEWKKNTHLKFVPATQNGKNSVARARIGPGQMMHCIALYALCALANQRSKGGKYERNLQFTPTDFCSVRAGFCVVFCCCCWCCCLLLRLHILCFRFFNLRVA